MAYGRKFTKKRFGKKSFKKGRGRKRGHGGKSLRTYKMSRGGIKL